MAYGVAALRTHTPRLGSPSLMVEVPHKLNARQREALEAFEAASKDERGPLAKAFIERMKKLLG